MPDAPNIVFVVFDTMRKDVLQPYGGTANTPHISSLINDSVVYANCIAPSPWTIPSHASFLTGMYPSEHGIHETYDTKIPQLFGKMNEQSNNSVTTLLRRSGYNTMYTPERRRAWLLRQRVGA